METRTYSFSGESIPINLSYKCGCLINAAIMDEYNPADPFQLIITTARNGGTIHMPDLCASCVEKRLV